MTFVDFISLIIAMRFLSFDMYYTKALMQKGHVKQEKLNILSGNSLPKLDNTLRFQ